MANQSEQIEQQARQTRTRIAEKLELLRDRMTPGQVLDQAADYARQGPASELFRNLGREIRDNPLPLTLTVIGLAWLVIASTLSSRARSRVADLDRPSRDAAPDAHATNKADSRFDDADRIVPIVVLPRDEGNARATRFGTERAVEPMHEQ